MIDWVAPEGGTSVVGVNVRMLWPPVKRILLNPGWGSEYSVAAGGLS